MTTFTERVELLGLDKSLSSEHLRNVFAPGEREPERSVAKNATAAADGNTCEVCANFAHVSTDGKTCQFAYFDRDSLHTAPWDWA